MLLTVFSNALGSTPPQKKIDVLMINEETQWMEENEWEATQWQKEKKRRVMTKNDEQELIKTRNKVKALNGKVAITEIESASWFY